MTKVIKLVNALIAIVRKPWLLNKVLADDSVWSAKLPKEYQNGFPLLDINKLCPNIKESLNVFAFLDGSSLPTDMALLKALCRRFENCSYFEIGTWRGESVANVSDVAVDCTTLNLSQDEIIALGLSSKYAELHGFFSKSKSNVLHLTGNTKSFDFAGLNKKYDVIFIDGDHTYPFVQNDTAKVFEHLLHEHSIVIWHDYAYTPEKIRPEVIKGILDGVPKQFHKNMYHVSNTMCAVFIREEFDTEILNPPIRPNKSFRVDIEIN